MSEGPIPWTAIYTYARVHGVNDPAEIDRLSAILKRMDIAYMEYMSKQRDKRMKAREKGAAGRPGMSARN